MGRSAAWRRWRELIAGQARSGLSIAEFCRQSGVAPASFYQWRKKLREASFEGEGFQRAEGREAFVPVSIVAGAGIRVEWPCGAVVRLPAGDQQSLSQIITLLLAQAERDG